MVSSPSTGRRGRTRAGRTRGFAPGPPFGSGRLRVRGSPGAEGCSAVRPAGLTSRARAWSLRVWTLGRLAGIKRGLWGAFHVPKDMPLPECPASHAEGVARRPGRPHGGFQKERALALPSHRGAWGAPGAARWALVHPEVWQGCGSRLSVNIFKQNVRSARHQHSATVAWPRHAPRWPRKHLFTYIEPSLSASGEGRNAFRFGGRGLTSCVAHARCGWAPREEFKFQFTQSRWREGGGHAPAGRGGGLVGQKTRGLILISSENQVTSGLSLHPPGPSTAGTARGQV